ncbi:MAG: 16S rRNA (cytosine(1402)-N(4))-methyltransferase RsmH [Lachnospiraceae bacterium]|nr:16S rRNA (cytosine(1402)-N(4))-methyltransferase RsmH [Lachnospiraceae bacterium]
MSDFAHVSVLLGETIEALKVKPNGIYVDGTLGGAGHSSKICELLGPEGMLIGIDQDEAAIAAATKRLEPYRDKTRICIVRDNYRNVIPILTGMGIEKIDGMLLDLGVSSYQFDQEDRGFSYRFDAPLDMRMDQRQTLSARDIVNNYSEQELYRIIRDYGEDPFAKNIAKHIVKRRNEKPIETTFELTDAIKAAIPAKVREKGGHPSKRTFQAIRIECNRELEVLGEALDSVIDHLNPGGRFAIITFHSLEDRMVKQTFRDAENPCTCPPDFPVCVCGKKSKGKVITRKAILPSPEELEQNPRSASAKLRVFERS